MDFMNFLNNDKNLPQKFCYAIATIQYVRMYIFLQIYCIAQIFDEETFDE